ncbi:MAG: hypothetical protein ACLRWQ_12875 [Flavonifractor plautii]
MWTQGWTCWIPQASSGRSSDDETTGLHLAFTGAVRDEVMDSEELAASLLELLRDAILQSLEERYKVTVGPDQPGWELLEQCAESGACSSLAVRRIPGGWPECCWTSSGRAS